MLFIYFLKNLLCVGIYIILILAFIFSTFRNDEAFTYG